MTEMSFYDRVQIWHRNKPPAHPSQFQVSVRVSLPGSDVDVLPGRVLYYWVRHTYAFELGLFASDDSFCTLELYADKMTRWMIRQQVRRVLAIRCVLGLCDEFAKPRPVMQKLVPVSVPLSSIVLPRPLPHRI